MQGDDIREQIEALRQEVRGLSTSILNLRQDDMRKVFGDQIRPVLMERIERHYRTDDGVSTDDGGTSKETLSDLVDRTISIFQGEGRRKALSFLSDHESANDLSGEDPGKVFEGQLVTQLKEYLLMSDHVFNQQVPEVPSHSSNNAFDQRLSPEDAERLMAPLSNSRRVRVMLILSREANSLAELSKELDLKKGHLQFHLKALMDVDYIRFDRKSRLYSISSRGTRVLDGVTKLIEDLSGDQ